MKNYNIKYKTFNQLLDEVAVDFPKYRMEDLISPEQLIKVAKRCNYDLGLRIMSTKEQVLEVENGKTKLPHDFFILNHALICGEYTLNQYMPSGTHIEEIPVTRYMEVPESIDVCATPTINCEATVCGCGNTSCNGSCGCSTIHPYDQSNYQCSTDTNTETNNNTVTTEDSNSTTETTSTEIHNCTWTFDDKDIMLTDGATIIIDGDELPFKIPGSPLSDASVLNSLDRGFFVLVYDGFSNYTLTVEGTNEYSIITSYHQDTTKTYITPECVVTITNTTVTTNTNNLNTVVTNDTINNSTVTCINPCTRPRVILNCKNEEWEVVQTVNQALSYTYSKLLPLKLDNDPQTIVCDCPNLYVNAPNSGYIKNGFIYVNFDHGKIYLSYQGLLEDEEGNISVPDHDGLNDFYEYALKQRILENLLMMDENVSNKIQLVEERYRKARIVAKSIVNTPNFEEMKKVYKANRRAQYFKYYDMFIG